MIKLTNILHELFAASKNVARFELLAELKISEIDVMLDEGKEGKYNFIGTDLKKAEEEVNKWRKEWKSIPGNSGKEPSSSDLEKKEGSDKALHKYIYETFIKTGIATWNDFGFPELRRKNTYSKTIGTDLKKATDEVDKWREEWKKIPGNSNKEPSSSDLKEKEGSNKTLYRYIHETFIKTKIATWNNFGFPELRTRRLYSKTIGTDLKKAEEEVNKWRKEWKSIPGNSGESTLNDLQREKEKGGNITLYDYIYKTFIDTRIATWVDFGFPELRTKNTYSETIGTDLEKVKKAIANWKEEWKSIPGNSGEPSSNDLFNTSKEKGGNNMLHDYITKNIFPLMGDGANFQKWPKLGLKSQVKWSELAKEDFIEVIKKLNLEENNYISELVDKNPNFYRGILRYMQKNQITNLKQRRDFWNNIGMQYVPQEEKLIYAYEFINVNGVNGDNRVYVGLTNDPNRRYREHMGIGTKFKSSLNDFKTDIIKQEKLIKQEESIKATENPEILTKEKKKLTAVGKFLQEHPEITSEQVNYIIKTDFMDAYEAAEKEGEILNEYLQNKWTKLNVAKTGSLGGGYKSARKPKSDSQEKINIANDIAREMTLSKYKKI